MSEIFNLTENQVQNVKHVLFGNQKQANVINEAVVKLVARGLCEVSTSSACDSEESVIKAITEYFQTLVDNQTQGNPTLIMLMGGEQSLANLREVGPKVVIAEQPNPESPKYIFRIRMLGVDDGDVDMSAESSETTGSEFPAMNTPEVECPYEPTDDFPTRARKIKDAILPLIPDGVKMEIPNDEYAQALCCAEYYYKNK